MTPQLQRKSFAIKALDESGALEAVISTLGVIDHDGDILVPGALAGKTAPIMPAHQQHTVPLGKVTIEEQADLVVAKGMLNLDIPAARDWHSALKFDLEHPPAKQEWSYGYHVLDFGLERRGDRQARLLKDLDLVEVSPVLRGASIGTGTLAVKAKAATAPHKSETSTAPWDGPANERRLPSPVPVELARRAYAWIDEEAIEDGAITKSACRFIHHFVDGAGGLGAASTRAAVTGIAVLNGARGGTTIPEADRGGVWRHLSRHLSDADVEATELAARDAEPGCKLGLQVTLAAWDIDALLQRLQAVDMARQERGQKISGATLTEIAELLRVSGDLSGTIDRLRQLAQRQQPQGAKLLADTLTALAVSEARRAIGAW